MTEWQPIESAPRDGTVILIASCFGTEVAWWEDAEPTFKWRIFDSTDLTPSGCCDMEDDDRVPVNGAHAGHPTHWAPLPSPPTGEVE